MTPFSPSSFSSHLLNHKTELLARRTEANAGSGDSAGGRVQEIWFTALRVTRRQPYGDELPGAAHPRGADVWTNLGAVEA